MCTTKRLPLACVVIGIAVQLLMGKMSAASSYGITSAERAAWIHDLSIRSSIVVVASIVDTSAVVDAPAAGQLATRYTALVSETIKGVESDTITFLARGGRLLRRKSNAGAPNLQKESSYLLYINRCESGLRWLRHAELVLADSVRVTDPKSTTPLSAMRDSIETSLASASTHSLTQASDAVIVGRFLGPPPDYSIFYRENTTHVAVIDSVLFHRASAPAIADGDTVSVSIYAEASSLASTPELPPGVDSALVFLSFDGSWRTIPNLYAIRHLAEGVASVHTRTFPCDDERRAIVDTIMVTTILEQVLE